MLGEIVGKRIRGQQRMRRLVGIIKSMDMSLSILWVLVMDRKAGVLRFMGSQRVVHDWTTEEQQQWIVRGLPWGSAVHAAPATQETRVCAFHPCVGKIPWRRERQPTPVFLSEKSHGQRSLVGHSPWSHKSDTTE